MRKILSFFIFCLIALCASGQSLQSIVNDFHHSSGGSTTVTFTSGGNCTGFDSAAAVACFWLNNAPSSGNGVVLLLFTPSGDTISSVCDGTGTNQCTGSSTYQSEPAYSNVGSGFQSQVWYTCNYQGVSGPSQTVTMVTNGSYIYALGLYMSGNTTTGTNCIDGYNKAQSTSAGTTATSGTITTTNAHDLFVGLSSQGYCSGDFVAGSDGQGNTMTQIDIRNVISTQYFNESATNTFSATTTMSSCTWNEEAVAFK